MRSILILFVGSILAMQNSVLSAEAADADVVVIAHASVPSMDAQLLSRLYTGRAVSVGDTPVTVVNAAVGSDLRNRFLGKYLQQDDRKYRAYWMVRRHVGKGIPPREFQTVSEMIEYVQRTPGAIGYVESSDVKPGLHIVLRL